MNTKKVGSLISKLRKEKNLSQQELADLLGVSPKTISKWECGNGLPDISILKKVSEVLGVTIEELLEGNQSSIPERKRTNKIPTIIIISSLLLIIISIIITFINQNEEKVEYNCEVTRVYYIDNVSDSNDGNYRYITVHEFQVEGTYTIKIPRSISDNIEENNSYEFTLKTTEDYVKNTTDNLFNNSEIINVSYTDKVGLEQVSTYHCN